MGGAGVSEINGYGTGYYNPASLAWTDITAIEGTYYEYLMDIDFYDMGVSGYFQPEKGPWGSGFRFGWAVSYWTMIWPESEERTIYTPEGTVSSAKMHEYYMTGSLAAAWKKGIFEIGIGETTKYLEYVSSGISIWAFDLGVITAAEFKWSSGYLVKPRIGFSFKDIGSGLTTTSGRELEFIQRYRLGGGFDFTVPHTKRMGWMGDREVRVFRMSVSLDLAFDDAGGDKYMEEEDMWAFGAELSLFEFLYARVGKSNNMFVKEEAATFGFGLKWDNEKYLVKADYGLVLDDSYFEDSVSMSSFRLMLGYRR